MATVALTPQQVSDSGIAPAYTGSLSTGNTYTVNNEKPFILHFKKSGAGICNVVLTSPAISGERAATSKSVAVPATTGDKMIGPFDPNDYNNGPNVVFTVSEITGLTVAVIDLPLTHRHHT